MKCGEKMNEKYSRRQQETQRKKRSAGKLIKNIFCASIIFYFVSPIVMMWHDFAPKRIFNEDLKEWCVSIFGIKFDGSFTPAEFRKSGFQDPAYSLRLDGIADCGAFMENQYGEDYSYVEYHADRERSCGKESLKFHSAYYIKGKGIHIEFYLAPDGTYSACLLK